MCFFSNKTFHEIYYTKQFFWRKYLSSIRSAEYWTFAHSPIAHKLNTNMDICLPLKMCIEFAFYIILTMLTKKS